MSGYVEEERPQSSIRVLIVEDSMTVRQYLKHIIDVDERLQVVATAGDGAEGVRLAGLKRPDIITMDIEMPRMDGFEAIRRIMADCPAPIVVVTSSWHPADVETSFRAIEAGALTTLEKPPGPGHPRSETLAAKLVQALKTMSEVPVVRRRAVNHMPDKTHDRPPALGKTHKIDVVAVGASTGGPPVIKTILGGVDPSFSAPFLIVQHMSRGFIEGMAAWLDRCCRLSVRLAADGQRVENRTVYFAPDDRHMGIRSNGRIVLGNDPPEYGMRPAVAHLFRSVADAYGPCGAGILLSGMGRDGALELLRMKEAGALTMAQHKDSCAVYGMPAEAVNIGGADMVLSPGEMTDVLNTSVRRINA